MKFFYTLILLIFTAEVHAQTGWTNLPGAPVSSRVDDIYFLNPETGVAVEAGGKIYRTEDGGETWSMKLSTSHYMRSVEFINDTTGFAGTLYQNFYKTTDGGNTWTDISNLLDPSVMAICGLNAASESVLYGVGVWSEPAYVIKSTDAGASWSFINMNGYAHGLVDCYFFSPDKGFVTGIGLNDEAIVLYTNDGGLTWENKFSSDVNNSYAWKIQFLNANDGVICIASENFSSASEMALTSDGGMTWTVKTVLPTYLELEGIGFMDKAHGWVGGYFNGMYETTDTGNTWNFVPFGKTLNRFFKVNDTLMYSSGHSVYKFTDSTGGVFTGTAMEPFQPVQTIRSIYPNPSTEEIVIEYTLQNQTMVDLSLFDVSGKRVKWLVHSQQVKGDFTIHTEVASLPAGKYFIVLHTNEGAVVSDFINIK
jgi:photosystem II stability/assembly factor-like uncharacterized protein